MSKVDDPTVPPLRDARREAARRAIVEAAWELAREEGLGGLGMRELAKRAGTTTPTLYAYFESKHAILDAMFADGQRQLAAARSAGEPDDPIEALRWLARTFVSFCTENPVRYQLLFQRPVPGFVPSENSYAVSAENLEVTRRTLAAAGLSEPAQLDAWTAVWAGVTAQQIANDPGGDRWTRHLDDFFDMYLEHHSKRRTRRR